MTATVPYHPGHVTDLRGLLDVGARIWGDEVVTATAEAGSRNRAWSCSPVPRAPEEEHRPFDRRPGFRRGRTRSPGD